jgi:type III secretion system needle length determinant
MVESMVDRLLVLENGKGGAQEVRIQLSRDVMPGTEVIIKRNPEGILKVNLAASDPASERILFGAKESLGRRLEGFGSVEVTVTGADSSGAEDNDRNRRSRGLMDQDPER